MSLRKLSSGRIEKHGFWKWTRLKFFITKNSYFSLHCDLFENLEKELEEKGIYRVGRDGHRALYVRASDLITNLIHGRLDGTEKWDGLFWADAELTIDEVNVLFWERDRKQQKQKERIERLSKIRDRQTRRAMQRARRERIPDEVRAFVWERDEGRCVRCGAEDDLQFDHVIPVAKGGGSAVGNIQILCGDCNRQKRDAIV